ncbi:MAG TPA: hypothetical protein VM617_00475 [Thermoanaerobaculia bacterium]|nr:hypothetical protein [Thermoanaerobaculia bacterium]
MNTLWLLILLTAALTALATVGLAWLVFRGVLARQEAELERRLEEALARTAREVGDVMEMRLRGVIADALADFRAGAAANATRSAAVTGAELLQEGLRLLMGGPAKPPGTP